MKVPRFILSTVLATITVLITTPHVHLVASQKLAHLLRGVKIISDGGTTVGGYKHLKQQFQEPIIRSAEMVDNKLLNAYWIDFHDQFNQHAQFMQLVQTHPGITLRHEFWDTINAVSVSVRDESILKEILGKIDGIKMVEPVIIHDRPKAVKHSIYATGTAPKGMNFDIHEITGVKQVHESLKLYGKGIKIGIIDSGVDYRHPALGGCFGPGCKVAYGTDFVGDDGRSPHDDPLTECDGHGTHVAGIIAANDTDFVGVAPQATLGAYRVFGCQGGTSNDLIMKALIRAVGDGMQVINLSLGGPGGWRQEREAHLADEIAKNGTIIVAAMGNEGQMGLFEASSPGVAGSVLTVASTENEFRSNMYFTVDAKSLKTTHTSRKHEDDGDDNDEDEKKKIKSKKQPDGDDSQSRAILYLGDFDMDLHNTTLVAVSPGTSGKVSQDACSPIKQNLSGKIALIRRGDCTFKTKVANAYLAHAAGVIFMDNVPSPGFAADTEGAMIKVRTITLEDGEYLLRTIKNQKKEKEGIKLIAGKGSKQVRNPNGGFLSIFSSMGPDSELNSKPDIAAPGGQIWSTFPRKLGSYASLSGTSMATPYVVGCVGLYLEGTPNGDHSAKAVKTAFQNSARPRKQQTGYSGYASVTQQGAGLLSMMEIISSKTTVTPSYISLNDTEHLNSKQQITITNTGTMPLEYRIDIVSAAGLVPFDRYMMVEKSPVALEAKASIKISQNSLTVPAGSSSTVDLQFAGPSTDPTKFVLYSGYVRLTPNNISPQSPIMHIPYMGMQGNFKEVDILDPLFGLRLFDAHGRPMRARGDSSSGRPTVGADSAKINLVEITSAINDAVNTEPRVGDNNDIIIDGRPRPSADDMKIVFRMMTAAELLVLDLVSAEGSDPYQVQSFGLIRGGVARFIPRNDQMEGNTFQVMGWDGDLLKEDGSPVSIKHDSTLSVIKTFRLRISLLKHFGNPEHDLDFESYMSDPFSLD